MHSSAWYTSQKFFQTYVNNINRPVQVIEIGSLNINGSIKDHITTNVLNYIGLDFAPGNGVDVVLTDPYKYPLADAVADIVVTSSCFEHSEMFWLTFLEGLRLLKPNGLMYCNVPSAWMAYHRHPVDCWRFWPDAAKALETWANYNNVNASVLESYISHPGEGEDVADWVAVFIKDKNFMNHYPQRMLDTLVEWQDYFNAFRFPGNNKFAGTWEQPYCEYHQATKKYQTLSWREQKI
jgi:hypothetical protein